jgi:anthraniloyl-CoA monooxygenase
VRISANDWVGAAGIQPADAVVVARALVEAGAELIDVSAGETASDGRPVYGRMYQTPFADRIRNELHVPVIAVGNIYEADHVNSILAAGRADLVALGRPHLANPMWTLHQAVKLGYPSVRVPEAYRSGVEQLGRIGNAPETAIA